MMYADQLKGIAEKLRKNATKAKAFEPAPKKDEHGKAAEPTHSEHLEALSAQLEELAEWREAAHPTIKKVEFLGHIVNRDGKVVFQFKSQDGTEFAYTGKMLEPILATYFTQGLHELTK